MRVLLLRPDRAGDAIKSLPVVRALRASAPEIQIHVLASPFNAALFELEPGIRIEVLPANWKDLSQFELGAALAQISETPWDKAIGLLADPYPEMERLLLCLNASERYSVLRSNRVPGVLRLELPGNSAAERDETLNIAHLVGQALGMDLVGRAPNYSAAPLLADSDLKEAREKMGVKTGRWLGLCPVASNTHRTPPLRSWQKFIEKVSGASEFDRIFLFGSPTDYKRLESLREVSSRKECTELCFPSSIRALGAYLKQLDGVIGVDTGPLHLARALGVRSMGILSGGDVKRWYPHAGQGDFILRRGLLHRNPSLIEMLWAFEKWRNRLVPTV